MQPFSQKQLVKHSIYVKPGILLLRHIRRVEKIQDLTPGETYNFTLTPEDPAFIETSEGVDVALAPVNETAFIVAWVDNTDSNITARLMNANGSVITTYLLDTTADAASRVTVSMVNSTTFIIGWVDGPSDDYTYEMLNIDGTSLLGPTDIDTNFAANTQYDWVSQANGNVLISDVDSIVSYTCLVALGRNTTGGIAANDFTELDTILGSTTFNDSVQVFWATDASTPKQTISITAFNNLITDIPFINSTNSSNFITGILWDSSDDTNGEFDPIEQEDIVFIIPINDNQQGGYGIYDFEGKYPGLLREYEGATDEVSHYVELI